MQGTPQPLERFSRRSRFEALVSKYEAAAEVVRTHADTDVALQPQDQPIAEEEPQTDLPVPLQLVPTSSGTPYAVYTASPYGARSSFADDGQAAAAAAGGGADGDDAGGMGGGGSMATGFRSNGSGLLQGAGASVGLSPGLSGMGSLLISPSGGGAGAGIVPLVSPVSGMPDRRRSVGGAGLGMRVSGTLLPAMLGGEECDVEAGGGLGGGHGGGGGLRRLDSDADRALAEEEEAGLGAGALPLDPMAVGVPGMGSLSLSLGSGGAVMSPFATDGMGAAGGAGGAAGSGAAGGAGAGKGRGARRHREKPPKKAPLLAGSNWLKIDYKGVDSVIRVDRHKLMHKLGVQARDLRLLDLTSATPPAILDRDKAIIVNLWAIKCVITLDYVLVVGWGGAGGGGPEDRAVAELVGSFVGELKRKLSGESNLAAARAAAGAGTGPHTPRAGDRPAPFAVHGAGAGGRPGPVAPPPSAAAMARGTQAAVRDAYGYGSLELPFELKVLELCLDLTACRLDEATRALEDEAYPTLDSLTQKVSALNLEKARRVKNRLVRLTKNVESVREVLERFLNDDGDMHRLHLTGAELSRQVSMRPGELGRLSAGLLPGGVGVGSVADSDSSSDSSIDEAETAAVEMLLEAYFMQVDNTYNRLQTVHEYIKDTEDLVTIQLDQHRNQLISIDLILTSFTTALAMMTVVGGFFGMNLDSGLQEAPRLFNAVAITTSTGCLLAFGLFIYFLHAHKLLYY